LSWSIGFVVPEGGRRRRGKVTELTEIDLAEISAVATPANADARTLSIKSLDDHDSLAQRESKLVADAHAKALAFHRERSRPPITVRTFEC
jgi:phage head maturation protease